MSENENNEKENRLDPHDQYLLDTYKKRDELYFNAVVNQSNLYDKYIFVLAAGSLSVSLTLIKDMFSNPVGLGFLIIAWLCFGVSTLVSLYSFLLGQKATQFHFIEMQNDTRRIFGKKELCNPYTDYPRKTELANQLSFWFLTGGFVCIFLFAFINFYHT